MVANAPALASRRIAVIGLGYVGLPVALAFARCFPNTIGFDLNEARVRDLQSGRDTSGEISTERLRDTQITLTAQITDLLEVNTFIVCVPTPIYRDRRPDLRPLERASELVGSVLRPGSVVIYESTVYPGLTEEFCGPILARVSGLRLGADFVLGYSPERINPGDHAHSFEKIAKVVAANDDDTRSLIASLYGAVIDAEIYVAGSIRVAEAAKILENTQRDLNIALMNELAIICDHLNIRTKDVLDAARTKWNFLPFSPGLVGGHCIGVDPYYLTSKAQEIGYQPEVILAGRRINDSMGKYIAQKIVRFLAEMTEPIRAAKVGILGATFKENISDIRNSRVPDIIAELKTYGVSPKLHDPLASSDAVSKEYGITLCDFSELKNCDVLVLAIPHASYLEQQEQLWRLVRRGGTLIDVRSALDPKSAPPSRRYWSL